MELEPRDWLPLPAECDVCHQPATIRDTEVVSGTVVARHFCADHGDAAVKAVFRIDDPKLQADFNAVMDSLRNARQGGA